MRMVNDISNEINNNFFSIGIIIDPSQAFDTINHKLLIKKIAPPWSYRHRITLVY